MYTCVADNDGHDYVIPVDKENAWWDFLAAIDQGDWGGEMPEWATRINGTLKFDTFSID